MNTPPFKTNYFGTLFAVQGGDPRMTAKMDTFKRSSNYFLRKLRNF